VVITALRAAPLTSAQALTSGGNFNAAVDQMGEAVTERANARAADLAPHRARATGGRRAEPTGHRCGIE
jgi:hypothetical protein